MGWVLAIWTAMFAGACNGHGTQTRREALEIYCSAPEHVDLENGSPLDLAFYIESNIRNEQFMLEVQSRETSPPVIIPWLQSALVEQGISDCAMLDYYRSR